MRFNCTALFYNQEDSRLIVAQHVIIHTDHMPTSMEIMPMHHYIVAATRLHSAKCSRAKLSTLDVCWMHIIVSLTSSRRLCHSVSGIASYPLNKPFARFGLRPRYQRPSNSFPSQCIIAIVVCTITFLAKYESKLLS